VSTTLVVNTTSGAGGRRRGQADLGECYSHAYYGTVIFKKAIETANDRARTAKRDNLLIPVETSTHDLRHHYASVLLAAGESVVAVAERLGHDDASLVLNTFGHLMPDSEERTVRAVDDAWCALSVPSATTATR
jgi:integrase